MARKRRPSKTRPRKPARVKKRKSRGSGHHRAELVGLGLVALGLLLASVLYLGWNGGVVGGGIAGGFRAAIGAAVFGAPLALLALGGLMLVRSSLVDFRPFQAGIAVVVLGVLLTLGRAHGGYAGRALAGAVGFLLGSTGATLVGITLLVAGVLLVSGASVGALLRRSRTALRGARTTAARRAMRSRTDAAPLPRLAALPPVDAEQDFPDIVSEPESAVAALLLDGKLEPKEEPEPDGPEPFAAPTPRAEGEYEYQLPDRSVLRRGKPASPANGEASNRIAAALVSALAHHKVEATVTGKIAGPRVTRYELLLAPGTKMSKVSGLKDDLSYALATTEIRILAPIPGKQAVGVEVPNLSPNLVTLGDIYDDLPPGASPVSVWLGKDISGTAVWADLARMPHILIAGTTGSGKSGCINTILTSILLRSTPDEVRLILIDPKRIELNYYESIPHLLTPVVSSPKEASAVLANVVAEMERRYERLSVVKARSLPEANRSFRERGEDPLPYLLVVIDELADLMMVSPQAVEDAIIRLAQKSRAVGIHLVLATQRPSVDVITGMIKANVPSRIAFAVSSQTDSRVILDGAGAESLLGQGDMLFRPLGTSRLQRVQGAYVSEEEVALVVEQCRRQRPQELDETLLELPEAFAEDAGDDVDEEFDPDEDPLLERAIEIVVQTQTASVSLIQRRLRVGYTRAGRLIDMLERRGIISGYEGSKPRRVLVSENEPNRVSARL